MPNWTPQQIDAIEARGRSIIVSAAAGSGKTAVLVERLVRILSETDKARQIPADRMVVVTFTKDAASQMKARLTKKLSEKLQALSDSDDAEGYDWLLEQRSRLSSAKISTIHSFCFDLIRENADSLGISPQFAIAEAARETIYQRAAMDRVMEKWTSENPEMESLFSYFCANDDSEMEKVVFALTDRLGSMAFPRVWMNKAKALCADQTALFHQMRSAFCQGLERVIAFYKKGREHAKNCFPTIPEPDNVFLQKWSADLEALQAHLDYVRNAAIAALCEEPLTASAVFSAMPVIRKKADKERLDAVQKQCYAQITAVVSKQYSELIDHLLEPMRFFREDEEISRKVIPALIDLTEDYLDALFEEKCRQNVLAFSDAEDLTLRLLADISEDGELTRSHLAEQLSEQYDLIMVDEYQDSNNKQDCIFKLLSHGCHSDENGLHYGDNAFLVGDVKQSIYSFRQANPENFRRVIAESTPLHDCHASELGLVYLNQNFRSAPGVLDFVNALFSAVMRIECGEVHYDQDEQLNFGSPVYPGATDRTVLLLAREGDVLPPGSDLQAECIAQTIHRMLKTAQVRYLDDNGEIAFRKAEPSDFCVLMRSVSGDGSPLIAALRRRSIPVAADAEGGLLAMPEVTLIRDILRSVDNPMTDAALAAVLLSPVGGFTADDLARFRLLSSERRVFLQMRTLADRGPVRAEHAALQEKVQGFLSLLYAMQETAVRLPLEEAIWEIYELTDLLSLQSLYDDADARRSHLDEFARLAQNYRAHADLSAESCLTGWLRYLDHIESSGKELEIEGNSSERGCVAVKTIHKSKGLEYPFVFCAYLGHAFSKKPSGALLHADDSGLLGLRIINREKCTQSKTTAYHYLLTDIYHRERSEEMRLFYVALTRAEQQLFLVMDNPEGAKKSITAAGKLGELLRGCPSLLPDLTVQANCMQDWLLEFLFCSQDAEHLSRLMDGEESIGALMEYRLWQYTPDTADEHPDAVRVSAEPDSKLTALMKRQLAFTYDSGQSSLASKYSVTQLAHPTTIREETMRLPQFTADETHGTRNRLDGAARGTAVHKIMQLIDFETAAKDVGAALKALYDQGRISEPEYKSITPEKLAAFFESPLYQRIAQSDAIERERNLFVRIGELDLPEHTELIERYRGTDGILIGTMDLMFHEPDGWVIVDYKTDYAVKGEALVQEYSLQLALYRAAAAYILGEPVKELYLYSFTLDKALKIQK